MTCHSTENIYGLVNKRCESACPTDYLSIRVYLRTETTRSMGLGYILAKVSSWATGLVGLTESRPVLGLHLHKLFFISADHVQAEYILGTW